MSEPSLTVSVNLFAAYQEACGVPELVLEFPAGTPVAAVRDRPIAQHQELARWRDLTRFGINLEFVEPDITLLNSDEVVLLPPVRGG